MSNEHSGVAPYLHRLAATRSLSFVVHGVTCLFFFFNVIVVGAFAGPSLHVCS